MVFLELPLKKNSLQRLNIEQNCHPAGDLYVEVIPLTYGRARITVTDGTFIYHNW